MIHLETLLHAVVLKITRIYKSDKPIIVMARTTTPLPPDDAGHDVPLVLVEVSVQQRHHGRLVLGVRQVGVHKLVNQTLVIHPAQVIRSAMVEVPELLLKKPLLLLVQRGVDDLLGDLLHLRVGHGLQQVPA